MGLLPFQAFLVLIAVRVPNWNIYLLLNLVLHETPSHRNPFQVLNHLAATTDPLGHVETYAYDGADNLLTRVTPKGDTISFAYDAVNQLLTKTLPGGQVTAYTYDGVGNLTGVTDPDSVLTMTYDLANRLASVSTAGSPNQPSVTLSYAYDKTGNRVSLSDPTGPTSYAYDALNRLLSLTSPAGGATFTYDALSRRTSLTLPNGTQTTYAYDPASQLSAVSHQLAAIGQQINQAAYVYNAVGNRTSLTDRRGTQAFGYDPLDRLTSATHPLLLDPQTFSYDAVGNRTTNASLYNVGNQLTEDAGFFYEHDANGNLARKTGKGTGNHIDYTYDVENRLIRVDEFAAGSSTPVATSTYRYDGLGRRIEKVGNGITRRYIYDGEDILLEYDGSNVLQARYTHGPGIDEPIAMSRGGATYYYHADGLGTITDLTDASGNTAQSYAYDAWGNLIEQTGSVEQPYTYTGREFDSETGLYYYRARHYDPRTGRFLQRDPIGLLGGINLYGYVSNSPVNLNDPAGLIAPQLLLIGTGALFGGIGGAVGAVAQGASPQDVLVSAAIGAGVGAIGAALPILATAAGSSVAPVYVGALVGELSNIAGQLYASRGCFTEINVGSVIGSAIGGGMSGALRAVARSKFAEALPEAPVIANVFANSISTAPAVVLPFAFANVGGKVTR